METSRCNTAAKRPHSLMDAHISCALENLQGQVSVKKEQGEIEPVAKKARVEDDDDLYVVVKVARNEDLFEQIGENIYFDLVDHDKVRSFRVKKQMPFNLFKEEVAKAFGVQVELQRFWLWEKRQNHTYRPHRQLTHHEETQSVGQLSEVSNKGNNAKVAELKLFLDVQSSLDLHPISPLGKAKEHILIFFKFYDPTSEELRYVGRLFVKGSGKPPEILRALKEMAGLAAYEQIQLYEEIKSEPEVMCEHINNSLTFRGNQLQDGDIICFEKVESQKKCRYPDITCFLEYIRQRQVHDSFLGDEESPDANSEKELGNEYFKQKKFKEAIDCYSRSIALSPTAIAFANRAMGYLKMKRFEEAENDCTEALNLDDRYTKAYSRRATARKELGKLKAAIEDSEFALRLEPQNQELKKQHAEAKALYQKMPTRTTNDMQFGSAPQQSNAQVSALTTHTSTVTPLHNYPGAGQLFEEGRHTRQGFIGEKFEDIGGFSVPKAQASLYKQIWLKYGHIATSQVLTASYNGQVTMVSEILKTILEMHQRRLTELSSTMIDLWDSKIKMVEKLEFNIKWLRERFENVKKGFYGIQKLRTTLQEQEQLFKLSQTRMISVENEYMQAKQRLITAADELKKEKENMSALEAKIGPLQSKMAMYNGFCLKDTSMATTTAKQTSGKPGTRKPMFIKVDQLKPGISRRTLTVKVVSSKTVLQEGRAVAQSLRQTHIAECLVGDETGSIVFTARNEQVDMMKPGTTVNLHNAKIDMFKGFMRLAVDIWGHVEVTEPAKFVVKEDNNLSLVEYELVTFLD